LGQRVAEQAAEPEFVREEREEEEEQLDQEEDEEAPFGDEGPLPDLGVSWPESLPRHTP